MARHIGPRDLPTILKLTSQRVRQNGGEYEASQTARALAKGGIPYTKRNSFLYDAGGAVAGLTLAGCLVLLLMNAPFRAFSFLQALETNIPLLTLTLLFALMKQRLPAFVLSLSNGLLFGLIGILPTSLIIALISAAHRHDTRIYDRSDTDWLGIIGWSIGTLLVASVPVGLVWLTKRSKPIAFTNLGDEGKTEKNLLVALILAPCLTALALFVLTARHGSVLRYLLGSWGSHLPL